MLQIVVKREIPVDAALAEQWNGLVEQMERPQVFYTYEWALAVSRAYRDSLRPFLCLAYEGEHLVGLAALAEMPGEPIAFLAGFTADYCDFVSHFRDRDRVVAAIFEALDHWGIRTLVLANFPADSATAAVLRSAAHSRRYKVFSRPAYECSQIQLGCAEQREAVRVMVRSKQMSRRYLRAMAKVASVSVVHLKSSEELALELPKFARKHVARFLATGRISNLVRTERREFLEELATLLSQRGWIALSCLAVGERAVAWNYGFQYGPTWFWYQPTLDGEFQQFSPGFCLLTKIAEEACASANWDVIDLGLGAEAYKERLSNGTRTTLHITATKSRRVHWQATARYLAVTWVSRRPSREKFVRSAVAAASSVRENWRRRLLGRWLWGRFRRLVGAREEVLFHEWPARSAQPGPRCGPFQLQPLSEDLLADAAMQCQDDAETLAYLLRAARRLAAREGRGFALVDQSGAPLHFAWIGPFEGFLMSELCHQLQPPAPGAQLIYDCWTPHRLRGRGYFSLTISELAEKYAAQHGVWIFCAATNHASRRGIEAAGFIRRFSLKGKTGPIGRGVVQVPAKSLGRAAAKASAA